MLEGLISVVLGAKIGIVCDKKGFFHLFCDEGSTIWSEIYWFHNDIIQDNFWTEIKNVTAYKEYFKMDQLTEVVKYILYRCR